jgi:hypothetical protein
MQRSTSLANDRTRAQRVVKNKQAEKKDPGRPGKQGEVKDDVLRNGEVENSFPQPEKKDGHKHKTRGGEVESRVGRKINGKHPGSTR